tara:strand:+ start:2468 stop:2821 length:354 start_codon:yes stop_codon:yes gene_type:complete
MVAVTRVTGLGVTAGTLYSHNAKAMLVTVKNAGGSAIDLRAEDDAVGEAAEVVLGEVSPLMYLVTNSAAGTISIITDISANAADLQAKIRALGTAVGPNDIDVSGTTVADGSSVTVA